jgi:endo-1,4-beta-D-glucanase Y
MTNDLIIRKINNIDIYDLEDEQIFELKDTIVKNVNLKQLRESVNKAVLNLSGVGDPTWNADLNFIALDNQKRLNIVYMLISNLEMFEISVSNIKKNKYGCAMDSEQSLRFLGITKDLVDTVIKFGEFKIDEAYQNKLELEENKRLELEGGNN